MKKLLSIVLVLLMICSALLTACGDNVDPTETTTTTTRVDTGVPVPPEDITEGLAYELNADGESYTLVGIGEYVGTVINIPATYEGKPVTAITTGAFKFNGEIVEVYIPDSVVEMGESAFSRCSNLQIISIGAGITSVPKFAFTGCAATEVVIPDTVTSIDYTAFWDCELLETIKLGDGIKELGASYDSYYGEIRFGGFADFDGCKSLVKIVVDDDHPTFTTIDGNLYSKDKTTIVKYALGKKDKTFEFPDHVTTIEEGGFCGSVYLEEIVIPSTVKTVSNWAFQDSENLRKATVEAGVELIERWVFSVCPMLEEIIVSEDNPNYKAVEGNLYTKDGKVFMQYACGKADTKFTVPGTVEKIQNQAFSYANNLVEIVVSEGVKEILGGAFDNCEKLEKVTLPKSLETIASSAFCLSYNCTSIVYKGTKAMWNDLEKNEIWDNGMSEYTIKCSDGTIKSQ